MDSSATLYDHVHRQGAKMIDEVDQLLRQEIGRLGKQVYHSFQCAGAFLFINDQSGLLEPAFTTLPLSYDQLHPVNSLTPETPNSATTGIASIAFRDNWAVSERPNLDLRIVEEAKQWRDSYKIEGSLMAYRVNNLVNEPLGVVVVFADTHLDDLSAARESFQWDLSNIRDLLQRRKQAELAHAATRFNLLVQTLLRDFHHIRTVRGACQAFVNALAPLLVSSRCYLAASDDGSNYAWLSEVPSNLVASLTELVKLATDKQGSRFFVRNRQLQADAFWLGPECDSAIGSDAWSVVVQQYDHHTVACVSSRTVGSHNDHWTESDLQLIHDACSFFSLQLGRGKTFESLLGSLSESRKSDKAPPPEFALLCQMLREYFGIDQVLVTQVTRNGTRYEIATRWTSGFTADADQIMKSRPKHYPPEDSAERLDIMERIVSDCLQQQVRDIYFAKVGDHDADFTLDNTLNSQCQLKGSIYFVPCFFNGLRDISNLKSILHLGRSDGALAVASDATPMLQSFGQAFARWLEYERERTVSEKLRRIGDLTILSHDALSKICGHVKDVCGSLGCTLFLNIGYIPLIDASVGGIGIVTDLFKRFLVASMADSWDRLMPVHAPVVRKMLADFLGTNIEEVEGLVRLMPHDVATLVARSCYLLVADDRNYDLWKDVFELAGKFHKMDDATVIEATATVFTDRMYLPGFGLTGWVLRYRHPMLLRNKSQAEIAEFFDKLDKPFLTPAIIGIVETFKSYKILNSTKLAKMPFIRPEHANHISEDRSKRNSDDTYLAIPMQDVEVLGLTPGVMRVSNSVTVRHSFDTRDVQVLDAACRHVANLLREKLMRQEAYRRDEVSQRRLTDRIDHIVGKMKKSTRLLEAEMSVHRHLLSQEARAGIDKAFARLREISEVASGQQEIAYLSAQIRSHTAPINLAYAAQSLTVWMRGVCVYASAVAETPDTLVTIPGEDLIDYWVTVEELCRNMRNYAGIDQQIVQLAKTSDGKLTFLIAPTDIDDMDLTSETWQSYLTILRGKKEGRGSQQIRDFCERMQMSLEILDFVRDSRRVQVVRSVSWALTGAL